MRALGIDPGTAICGFGVVDAQGSRLHPVTYGTIRTSPEDTDAQRLVMLFKGLKELYATYQPDVVGVEQLFLIVMLLRLLLWAKPEGLFY